MSIDRQMSIFYCQAVNNHIHIIMKLSQLFLIILLPFLNVFVKAIYQNVNWPVTPNIKSGDHKLLVIQTVGPSQSTYTQPYSSTSQSYNSANIPNVVIGMIQMQVDLTTNPINYYVSIIQSTIKTTQFTSNLTILSNNTFSLLYYMYFVIDPAFANVYLRSYSIDTTNNFTDGTLKSITYNQTINKSIANYNSVVIAPFITSFNMLAISMYSIDVSVKMTNENTIAILVKSNSTLYRVEIMMIIVDKTSLESAQLYFVDYGQIQSWDSGNLSSNSFKIPSLNYFNYISGVNAIQISTDVSINFGINAFYQLITSTSFIYLRDASLQIRQRSCTSALTKYYTKDTQLCYDSCLTGYGTNNSTFFCTACSYTCLSCMGNGVSCLSCNNNYNRTFNSTENSCPCNNGYVDIGKATCSLCDYTCITCFGAVKSCLSCSSTRILTNNSCPCKTGLVDLQTNNTNCQACDYTCLSCLKMSTSCTSCDNATNRILDSINQKCLCRSGFTDNNTQICIASAFTCSLTCMTCQNDSNTCTSCNSTQNRVLSGKSCSCVSEYTSINSNIQCTLICGNGLMSSNATKECDDGNVVNGDGCSNTCTIESGYTCSSDSSRKPASFCISIGYSTTLNALIKDPSSNSLTAYLQINPSPPSSTIPSLLNLNNQLSITSHILKDKKMTINLQINGQVDASQTLLIGLSLINTTSTVSMVTTNLLVIKPYSNAYLTLYQAQIVLVWIYISLLWIGSVIFIVRLDINLFSGVVEIFIYSALAWISIQGQQTFTLLFQPLTYLRYIFGFNFQINNVSCLLQVLNFGFLMNILPFLGFLITNVIVKRYNLVITSKIKKFILYDISYSYAVINGFLVMYGLSLSTNQYSNSPVQIASLFVGTVYIFVFLIISFSLFFKKNLQYQINPKMEITRTNTLKHRIIPSYYLTVLLLSFIYIAIKKQTKLNTLFMMGSLLTLIIVFGLSNFFINKIRYLLNFISLFLIYTCILLINNVPSADWSGFLVLGLMYVQIILNFVFLYFQRTTKVENFAQLSETIKKRILSKNGLGRQNLIELQGQVQIKDNQDIDNIQKHQFSVYEPTNRKLNFEREISIQADQERNNQMPTIKKSLAIDAAKQKNWQANKRFHGHLSTPKKEMKLKKRNEQLDISDRQVKMDQI